MTHPVTDLLRAPISTGVELCYQTFGDPDREPLLLVMGLGGPLTWWDDALCRRLADEGFDDALVARHLVDQLAERGRPAPFADGEQADQHFGRRARVAERRVAALDLDAQPLGDGVEVMVPGFGLKEHRQQKRI